MDKETITIDIDDLRRDMMDYYGSAMSSGFPMAVMDLTRVERASGEELVQMATAAGMDIRMYSV